LSTENYQKNNNRRFFQLTYDNRVNGDRIHWTTTTNNALSLYGSSKDVEDLTGS